MIASIERRLVAEWSSLRLGGSAPRRLEHFLTTGATGAHGKVLFHLFRPGDPHPVVIVKIPRDAAARKWARHEWEFLKELEEAAPDLAGSAFPRAVFLEIEGARLAAGQTILPGTPADRLYAASPTREQGYGEVAGFAKGWLRTIWTRTGFLEGSEAALWEPFREAAAAFPQTFAPPDGVRAHVAAIREEIAARGGAALCAYGHGDLIPSNLIVDGPRVGAVDWEFGARRRLTWVDPVHFAISFSLHHGVLERRSRLDAFTRGFLDEGWLRERNFAFLADCFDEGGVPRDLLPLALPAYCIYFAVQMARIFGTEYAVTRDWAQVASICADPAFRERIRKS